MEKHNDFLDAVLDEVDSKESFLTEEIALDLVFLLLFASHETTSTAMTLAMKYLSEHPAVLAKLLVCDLKFSSAFQIDIIITNPVNIGYCSIF